MTLQQLHAGAPAPEFQLPSVRHGEVSLSALRGSPVLLVFNRHLG
jgi:peroxiredoxin